MGLFYLSLPLMKRYTLFGLIFLLILSCTENIKTEKENHETISSIIKTKMTEQENCWNKGDLECFMKHYWKNDSLEFIGKSGLNLGWQTTLDNYKNSYKNKDEMGVLSFEYLKEKQIDNHTFHVIGKWKLSRTSIGDTLQGHFTLIWQIKNGEWVIISDHSS